MIFRGMTNRATRPRVMPSDLVSPEMNDSNISSTAVAGSRSNFQLLC